MTMLRVTVDLVPFGDEDAAKTIGEMIIANDGLGNEELSNYVFALYDDKQGLDYGVLQNFYRPAGFWDLICDCLIRGTFEKNELVYKAIERLRMSDDV
jgi:hypothetical protein